MTVVRIILAFLAATIGIPLMVPLALLIIPFWIISILTRGILRLIEPTFLTRDQLIEFDPDFGWKARANLDTHHLMVDLFHLQTDADGWRGHASLKESEIVVFGDSFAAGYGVSDDHFFANLKGPYRIKPIGIGGYSMVQELLWMNRLAPKLKGKFVVWFIYHGNDLYDNLSPDLRGYRKPFVRERGDSGEWEIVSSHIKKEPWSIVTRNRLSGEHHLPKLAELCSNTFLAKRAYNACDYLIRRGKEICSAAEAELLILTIPDACQLTAEGQRSLKARGGNLSSFDPNFPDENIKKTCQRWDTAYLAGRTFLDPSCYKTNDCHWNEKGNRKVFEALNRLCRERPSQSASRVPNSSAHLLVQA